ncbi:MAG: hypothetical protein AB7V16_07345 [Vulcanibacillus sp.]
MKEYSILNKVINKMKEEYDYTKQYTVYSAIVDKKGVIISLGRNSFVKTHTQQYYYNQKSHPDKIFLHAEIDSLLKYKTDNGYVMIVCRMTKSGLIKLAKPCEGCMRAIVDSGIKKVYYTNNEGELVLMRI